MPIGKCDDCLIRWSWNGRPRVAEALCPSCQRPLLQTSQNSLLPLLDAIVTWNPVVHGPKYLTASPAVISGLRCPIRKIISRRKADEEAKLRDKGYQRRKEKTP